MQLSQPLLGNRTEGRYDFSREYVALLEDNPGVLNVRRFFDKARFYFDRCIKKQVTDLGPQRIQGVAVNPLYPELQYGTIIESRDIRSHVH
jgi:hypothetical protein